MYVLRMVITMDIRLYRNYLKRSICKKIILNQKKLRGESAAFGTITENKADDCINSLSDDDVHRHFNSLIERNQLILKLNHLATNDFTKKTNHVPQQKIVQNEIFSQRSTGQKLIKLISDRCVGTIWEREVFFLGKSGFSPTLIEEKFGDKTLCEILDFLKETWKEKLALSNYETDLLLHDAYILIEEDTEHYFSNNSNCSESLKRFVNSHVKDLKLGDFFFKTPSICILEWQKKILEIVIRKFLKFNLS